MPYLSTVGTHNGRNIDVFEVTANYTLTPNDNGKTIRVNAGAGVNITCPANQMGIGFVCRIVQYGAGAATVISDGSSILRSHGGLVATGGQYAEIEIKTVKPNEFLITGDRA